MSVLGLVTIGQTPRPDLEGVFGAAAPHARVSVTGALDGLDEAEVTRLAAPGAYPLLVRLASGRTMEIPLAALEPHVRHAAARLEAEGATTIVIVCAGGFPDIPARVPVVLPGRIVPAIVRAIVRTNRVGVVTPNATQVPFAERKWRADGFDPIVTWAAPGGPGLIDRAARDLSGADLDLVVLDCMGHTEDDRIRFARLSGRPVLAAQTLVARVAGALV